MKKLTGNIVDIATELDVELDEENVEELFSSHSEEPFDDDPLVFATHASS